MNKQNKISKISAVFVFAGSLCLASNGNFHNFGPIIEASSEYNVVSPGQLSISKDLDKAQITSMHFFQETHPNIRLEANIPAFEMNQIEYVEGNRLRFFTSIPRSATRFYRHVNTNVSRILPDHSIQVRLWMVKEAGDGQCGMAIISSFGGHVTNSIFYPPCNFDEVIQIASAPEYPEADLNKDCLVSASGDGPIFLANIGPAYPDTPGNFNHDDRVDVSKDGAFFLSQLGQTCP